MGFKINFNEENVSTGEFELVKEGKYEATIINAKAEEFNGNWNIGFDVEIRSDFEQDHQGAKILYNTLYLTSNNPEYAENTEKKVNAFVAAVGFTGVKQLDLNEVVKAAFNKQVFVYVGHRPSKSDPSKIYPRVTAVYPTKNPSNDPFSNSGPIEIGSDDLPF